MKYRMRSLEHSDTPQSGNNRLFLYPSPSCPESGIGLLLQASEIVNQPQSTPLCGVDLLLQAADLIESESSLVFDKPESGINLLLEASEQIKSYASSRPAAIFQAPASSLPPNDATSSLRVDALNPVDTAITWLKNHIASTDQATHTRNAKNDHSYAHPVTPVINGGFESNGRSHCQSVNSADPVDTAILWLEREIANSKKDAGKHLSPDKTVSQSTGGSSSAKSVTSCSRPGKSHRRKINGSKITKVTAASGCTCLGHHKKTLRKATKSWIQKRRSDDRNYMSVCCAKKTKSNKMNKVYDIITSTKCEKGNGSRPVKAHAEISSHVSPKTNANWTSGQTPLDKDTSTRKQGTSGHGPPNLLPSERSSATGQQFPISRKRLVQVVMPIRPANRTPVLPTPPKRPCLMSPWLGVSPDLGDKETRPLTRHQNRLAINGVRRKRLRHIDEPKSSSSMPITSETFYSHRPIGVVVPWLRTPTLHTNSSDFQHDLEEVSEEYNL